MDSELYQWEFTAKISEVFPEEIPLLQDKQKRAIYEWVKTYTGLPFEDVLEDEEEGE